MKSKWGYTSGNVKTFDTVTSVGAWNDSAAWTEHDRDTSIMPIKASASGSGRVYLGSPSGASTVPVVGTSTSVVGAAVCPSGANSGMHCAFVVQEKNFAYVVDGYSVLHAVRASSTSEYVAQGDSGGPVLRNIGGDRYLVGFISGVSGAPYICDYMTLNYQGSGTECGPQLYYVGGASSLLDDLNIELK